MTENSTSDNVMESVINAQGTLIEPVQENVVAGNQKHLIPVPEAIPINALLKPEEFENPKITDFIIKELSEYSTDELSEIVSPTHIKIKSEYLDNDDEYKIENAEHTLNDFNKMDQKDEIKSENDIADTSSTLATAALYQAPLTNETVDIFMEKLIQPPKIKNKQEEPAWCDVGIIKGTTCLVKQFYSTSITDEHENTSLDNLPDYINKLKIDIEPNTLYKFRIAPINSCGRGEWSEISTFKTSLLGYPNTPSNIKVTKSLDGASLTWESPSTSFGKILEYTVCMAIKTPTKISPLSPKLTSTNLNFFRVYCGPHASAVVSHELLGAALIDRTHKPAIIFRIAAKNEKGYGQAIQVRWLQNDEVHELNKSPSIKRENSVKRLNMVSKRLKI